MAAAAAHAHAQHKRGDANGSHLVNPLMTALMQDDSLYGTEVRRRSWLEKVFIALRGPLHEVEQSHAAQMHDFWSARDAADDTKEDYFSEARARAARARSTRARAATTDASDPRLSGTAGDDQVTNGIPSAREQLLSDVIEKRNQDHRWHKRRVVLTPTTMTVIVHQEEDHNDDKLSRQILRKGMLQKKNGERKKDCKPEHYSRRFFVIDGSGTVSYYRDEHGYRKQHATASSFSCIGLQIVEDAGRLEDGSVCFNLRVASSTPGAEAKVIECSCADTAERASWVEAFQEASQVYTRIEEMGLNKFEKRRLQAKLKAKQQQAPNVVMDVIPLADIYKVRILKSTAREDMLDLAHNRLDPDTGADLVPSSDEDDGQDIAGQCQEAGSPAAVRKMTGSPVSPRANEKHKKGRGHDKKRRGSQALKEDTQAEDDKFFIMEVHTITYGFEQVLFFRSRDVGLLLRFCKAIHKYARACLHVQRLRTTSRLQRFQAIVRKWYASDVVQIVVAILIVVNFFFNVAQTEILPEVGSSNDILFETADLLFTYIFIVELAVNLTANWFVPFFTDGWCIFDFVVVGVGIVGLIFGDIPGMSTLRLMRAFRVMRLFGRLESLRQIITALTSSLLPVSNALLIMLLVTSIYAILAVNFFAGRSLANFGEFSKALFSLFQVCTADSWSSEITRGIFLGAADPGGSDLDLPTALYMMSFMIIVSWTLLNVVVAVLLDNFTQAADAEKQLKMAHKLKNEGRTPVTYAIDRLLESLSHFETSEDLSQNIRLLFQVLDVNDSESISFTELQKGLAHFTVEPSINISRDDWNAMTENGDITDALGEVDVEVFEAMIRYQLKMFVQRKVGNAIDRASPPGTPSTPLGTILFVLKLLLIGVDDVIQNFQRLGCSASDHVGGRARTPAAQSGGSIPVYSSRHSPPTGGSTRLVAAVHDLKGDLKQVLEILHGHKAQPGMDPPVESVETGVLRSRDTSGPPSSTRIQPPPLPPTQLPEGWVRLWSRTKNRFYYKHEGLKKSSWFLPVEGLSETLPRP